MPARLPILTEMSDGIRKSPDVPAKAGGPRGVRRKSLGSRFRGNDTVFVMHFGSAQSDRRAATFRNANAMAASNSCLGMGLCNN